jgi:hypothetical protein
MLKRPVCFGLLVIVTACTAFQTGGTPSDPSQLVDSADVHRQLFALADDSMQGRRTATPGIARAARFIAAEMRRSGLEPAGDSGYFQRVPLALRRVEVMGRDSVRRMVDQLVLLPSVADLDTVPAERRRMDVNVVGMIRGSDPVLRDSAIVIGAHHDHIGIRSGATPDSINNGADDDASGVVTVLQIGKALARAQPKRTMVFATFTGEEGGGFGSRRYLASPVVPLARTTAQMQVEMIGRPDSLGGGFGKAWLTGYERSTMGDMLKANGIPIVADPRPCQMFFQRSDNIRFARIGIPAHTLSSFNMHADYHQVGDSPDKADIGHMTAVIRAGVRAAQILANGPAPTWHAGMKPPATGQIARAPGC